MQLGLKETFAIGGPYLVAVAALYLFGYWGAFSINVLELISFSDVPKLAIYPLLASFVFLLAGALLAELVYSPHLPPGGGAATTPGRFGRNHWRSLLSLNVLAILGLSLFGPDPQKWFLVGLLIAFFSTPLSHLELLIEIVPNPKWRNTSLFMLLLLPGLAFAHGHQQAFLVKAGLPERVVEITRSNLPLASDTKNPVSYLGFLGGTHILYEALSGQVVFLKQPDDALLFIIPKGGDLSPISQSAKNEGFTIRFPQTLETITMDISAKDAAVYLGILVTFVLGLYNLRHNKKTAFINTVTSERIKWIGKIRENISKLYALTDKWVHNRPQECAELLREIEQIKFEIRLQLNRKDAEDRELERLLERLPNMRQSMTPEDLIALRDALIMTSQDLLKREWEKVKEEAEKGKLKSSKS